MCLQTVVVLVVNVFIIWRTHIANHMFQSHMSLKLVLVEEVSFAESTIRVQENNVTKFIDVPSFQMFVQLGLGVEFLFL
jgi:hypothetical protein